MARPIPNHLKVYTEQPPEVVPPEIEGIGTLPDLLGAFEEATGWSLKYVPGSVPDQGSDLLWSAPVNPGAGTTPGHLRLEAGRSELAGMKPPVDAGAARRLASALAAVLGQMLLTQHALWQREAELAAGVPVVPAPDEQKHLAARLEAVLKGGAEAVGCQAAALYLLDEATSQLKLRSCWGLPLQRLTAPARPLRGAVADLEALLGHAVVLEDGSLMQQWKVPEDFPSAVCVPVASPTAILGTLWVFCTRRRGFNDRQTGILEVVAGRLAADLEREMLLREGIDAARFKRQLAAAEQSQRDQLPTTPPQVDGYDLAGRTAQAQALGGDFFDWFCLPDGLLAAAVGDASGSGIQSALSAAGLKTALRCHAQYHRQVDRVLQEVGRTLWTASAGDWRASLYYGLIEPHSGRVCYASSGQIGVLLLRPDGWESLSRVSPRSGEDPEAIFDSRQLQLQPGQSLVVFSEGVCEAADPQGRLLGQSGLAESLVGQAHVSARGLADLVQHILEAHAAGRARDDWTVLVVKRTDP